MSPRGSLYNRRLSHAWEKPVKRIALVFAALLAYAGMALAAVNINTATKEELDALPGIGPVKAQAIVDYRTKNGPFKSVDDVKKVKGIGDATFGKIKGDISVSGATTTPAKAESKAAEKKETAKEKTAEKKESVKEKMADTKEKVKEKTADVKEKVKEKAADMKSDKKEAAKEKADAKKQAAKEKADAKKQAAKEKADAKKKDDKKDDDKKK